MKAGYELLFVMTALCLPVLGAGASTTCDGVPTIPETRKACNMYIWDLPSALLYKWCHHLLKENLIEGKGGKLFVRYEPNSMLQLLYPCRRYSPDKCMVCGGRYHDHLTLWWAKNKYTPFDQYLDKTYADSLVEAPVDRRPSMRSSRGQSKSVPGKVFQAPRFAFHRKVVDDVGEFFTGDGDIVREAKVALRRLSRARKEKSSNFQVRVLPNTKYAVKTISGQDGARPSLTLRIARRVALGRLDRWIFLQERENSKMKDAY